MSQNDEPLTTASYKGVRDFYPEEKRKQNYLFSVLRDTAKRFGYQEVSASVLEPANLYDAKSGSELSQKQSYRFVDRGDREVMLRPEMTPTIARLMAARHKSLSFPVRWFSLPNLFRYERPQEGRLREHWQLNADLFGVDALLAEVELIQLVYQLLLDFGGTPNDFIIKINSRKLFAALCADVLQLSAEQKPQLSRLIDKREKMPADKFNAALGELLSNDGHALVNEYLQAHSLTDITNNQQLQPLKEPTKEIKQLLETLANHEVENATFDPSLVRGLDYYTGIVFEVFDTQPDNPRSIAGGGRYDDLMEIFDAERIPAVGFGLGDVTLANFLDGHDLWPDLKNPVDITVALVDRAEHGSYGYTVAQKLRQSGYRVSVDISGKALSTQIEQADKSAASYVAIVGDEEVASQTVTIKHLQSGEENVHELTALTNLTLDG